MDRIILVIEDDSDILTLTELILTGAGYTVLSADSGEEGWRMLQERAVDLLLLDIMLPGIDGWEVCRRLRADPGLAETPVLVFTVRSGRHERDRAACDLADVFLKKPFDRNGLLVAVAAGLQARRPSPTPPAA